MTPTPSLSLLDTHDALLLDLDGTVMNGTEPIPHAADAVRRAREKRLAIVFATNNASRTPEQAAEHVATVGVDAEPSEFITSPQVASRLLADELPEGSEVLVVGSQSLATEISDQGLVPVREDSENVVAVVQGWAPELDWAQLAQGCYAIRRGASWMATNIDATLPTEHGMAPGNGSMVAALRHATGKTPRVAGKPEPGMFEVAAAQVSSRRPLVVGDRLDTDIAGANRARMESLLVLTGVSTVNEALHAEPELRPTYVLADLSTLHHPFSLAVVEGERARCGSVGAQIDGPNIRINAELSDPRIVHAVLELLRSHYPDSAWEGDVVDADGAVVAAAK